MAKKVPESIKRNLPLHKGEDYTGKRIGSWIVLSFSSYNGGTYKWLCRCDCGAEKPVGITSLLYGRTRMCVACANGDRSTKLEGNPNWKGYGKIPGTVMQKIRMSCSKRARLLDCTIDCEYLDSLWDAQGGKCALSGRDLSIGGNASVDRIDSSKGYIQGNVQWVTIDINRAKWEMSNEQLQSLCRDVANLIK